MFRGARTVAVEYLSDVWAYRHFLMSLVQLDLRRRYRRSILGLSWSLFQPICMTIVLAMVYRNLFKMNLATFAPLLLTGLAYWSLISTCVLQGCGSLLGAESYIRQQSLPLVIFSLRAVLTMGFHFLLSLAMAIVFTTMVSRWPSPLAILSLIPSMVLLFFFCWALATIAGFAHVYFPDTQHLAEVGLQALMFLTPIVYPPSLLTQNGMEWLMRINPLAAVLQLIREPILEGQIPSLASYGNAVLIVSLPVFLAVYLVARLERRVIFAL